MRRKKLTQLAAAQHQQSFSFLNFKRTKTKEREREKDNTKEMDKVEYVDWPTQNVDRDKIPILLSLSLNRMSESLLNQILIQIYIYMLLNID